MTTATATVTVLDDNTGRALTIREEIRNAARNLINHADTDRVRALVADGVELSHDEADYLGEDVVDWIARRYDLSRDTSYPDGVRLVAESAAGEEG